MGLQTGGHNLATNQQQERFFQKQMPYRRFIQSQDMLQIILKSELAYYVYQP